jgi:hypothetical protein
MTEKIIAQISMGACDDRYSKRVSTIPPNHMTKERKNNHAAIPAIVDSANEICLSIQIFVNRRSRSHVTIRTASAMGKITYTIIPRIGYASV